MRLPWRFDVSEALQEARRLPVELWRTHFNQGRHDGGWQALALRHCPDAIMDVLPVDVVAECFEDTDALKQCPHIASILYGIGLPWKSVRLMQLQAGSEILEHVDADLGAAHGEARLHIPLQTDEQVYFHVNGQRIPMRAGECWYVDVSLPHRVRNRSAQSRIHLVMDTEVTPALAKAFSLGDQGDAMSAAGDPWQEFQCFNKALVNKPAWTEALMQCSDLATLTHASLELGRAHGYAFEASDIEAAYKGGRRAWNEQWAL